MEQMLLRGQTDYPYQRLPSIGAHPELNQHSLSVQIQMFKSKFHIQSLTESQMAFLKMAPEV